MFYAASYPYGMGVSDSKTGRCIANYHAFPTRAARDEWVAKGDPYLTQGGARAALRANDADLRRLLRDEVNARYYVQQHDAEGW